MTSHWVCFGTISTANCRTVVPRVQNRRAHGAGIARYSWNGGDGKGEPAWWVYSKMAMAPWYWSAPIWTGCRCRNGLAMPMPLPCVRLASTGSKCRSCTPAAMMCTWLLSLVGTARQLARLKDQLEGHRAVHGAKQAEERVGGANAMVKDGFYTHYRSPILRSLSMSLPNWKQARCARIGRYPIFVCRQRRHSRSGIATHGAAPHLAASDPVYIASQIVVGLQSIISREKGPLEPGVITVGAFHAGQKHNIISEHADLQVTVRANSQGCYTTLDLFRSNALLWVLATPMGLPEDKLPVVKVTETTPVTVNDATLARRLQYGHW